MAVKAVAMGHHAKSGGRRVYDGRIKFPIDDKPDVIEVDGSLYQRVVPDQRHMVTPEDFMTRTVR